MYKYINKKKNGANIDPCGNSALTLLQVDTRPLRTTLCLVLLKKSLKMFNKSLEIPFFSSF